MAWTGRLASAVLARIPGEGSIYGLLFGIQHFGVNSGSRVALNSKPSLGFRVWDLGFWFLVEEGRGLRVQGC